MKTILTTIFLLTLLHSSAQSLVVFRNDSTGKFGLRNEAGKLIVKPVYDTISVFTDGVMRVGKKVTYDTYTYGLVDKTGKLIAPMVHDWIAAPEDGIAVYQQAEKMGYMDRTGKKITPAKYNNAWKFSGGMAAVSVYDKTKGDDKWGFIDKTGREFIPLRHLRICAYKNGVAVIEKTENQYVKINKAGKETPMSFEKIGFNYYDRLVVKQGGKYGFINSTGELVIPLKYDNAWDFATWQRTGYLSAVTLDKKHGFIDTSGKEVIPLVYDWAKLFREGLCAVAVNGPRKIAADERWGYIDSTGKLVIPMIYNVAGYFSEGLAAVSIPDGKKYFNYGYIDQTGKLVIPIKYEAARDFSDGFAAVKLNGKFGFIDREGKLVIECKYDRVERDFERGWAKVVREGKNITINKKGVEQ